MTEGPRRTCVACRAVREKRQLVRLVRLSAGTVVVDGTGQTPGRGAYVCRGTSCAERLVKGGRLSQAFRRPSAADTALIGAVRGTEPISEHVGESVVVSERINVMSGR